jgi:electron transfer flavoprotein alpha/beta subunit
VTVWTAADLGLDPAQLQNRVNVEALYIPETKVETEFIEGDTVEEKVDRLLQRLREAKLI